MPPIKRSRQKSYEYNPEKTKHNHRNRYEQEMPKPVQWKSEPKFSQNLFGGESLHGIHGGPSSQPMLPPPPNVRNSNSFK